VEFNLKFSHRWEVCSLIAVGLSI